MSKLFSEAECLAIVASASGRPVCSPPAAKTEPAVALAVPVVSGQAGGTTTNSNAGPWRAIAEFLDAQHLAFFGLRRLSAAESAAKASAERGEAARSLPRIAPPMVITGTTTFEVPAL